MAKLNEYTNLYDWCDNHQGQTLDNKHKELWKEVGKLILSIHNMNIQVWECDNTLITIRTYATGCFKILDVQ